MNKAAFSFRRKEGILLCLAGKYRVGIWVNIPTQEGRVSKFKGRRLGTWRLRAGPGGTAGRAVEQRFEHLPDVWGLEELERCFCLFYFDFFSSKISLCNSPVLLFLPSS